ncbi:glycosyl transferase family 21-domain-containing protein [Lipomyces oligophaga]|uniref:glycosyl transferase family 21-domain-containing protein n=1 Tax=Lipomyces oligophaga TaxID=45792 RepID=UPI0034CE728A
MAAALTVFVAAVFATWYVVVWLVCTLGYIQLRSRFAYSERSPPVAETKQLKKQATMTSRTANSLAKKSFPGVSILRPLKGVDLELRACLASAFEQDYPAFELLLCVDDPADPAIPIVKSLMQQYAHIPVRLFVGAEDAGVNPKVNNLIKAYEAAAYDIVWILDSNCWVVPSTLKTSIATFERDRRIELVHHLPLCVAVEPRGWGARLDEMFLSTAHAKFYVAINTVAVASCIMGKSNLFRKSTLDAIDPSGLRPYSKYIAEDQTIGEAIWHHGGLHAMASEAVIQPVGANILADYFFRRMRWLRVRKYIVTAATLVEPMTESLFCGAMGTFAASVLIGSNPFAFFITHMIIWCMLDYWIFRQLHGANYSLNDIPTASSFATPTLSPPYFARPRAATAIACGLPAWLKAWLLREFLALPIWITAMSGTKIEWRTKEFKILPDSTAVIVSRS